MLDHVHVGVLFTTYFMYTKRVGESPGSKEMVYQLNTWSVGWLDFVNFFSNFDVSMAVLAFLWSKKCTSKL